MPRCANCGFLATRDKETRVLEETEKRTRDTGRVPSDDRHEEIPVCFAQVISIQEEARGKSDQILPVLQKERECNNFAPWIQGFTPKEHKEMLDAKEMREWQAGQAEKTTRLPRGPNDSG